MLVNADIFENHIWCNMAETIMVSIRRCIHKTRYSKSSKPYLVADRAVTRTVQTTVALKL